jgi:NAD(P)-dependent dehydrogenase (short-subunit alcohol dehydrogenase family)
VRAEKLGEVAAEFDGAHSIERAQRVGSVHQIVPADRLRPYLVAAVRRAWRSSRSGSDGRRRRDRAEGGDRDRLGRGDRRGDHQGARAFGVHVAVGYSWNRGATDDLASKLTAEGCSVSVHQGNLGKSEDCQRVVSEVLEGKGRVDHLVNNAGIAVDKTMRKMTVEDWHAVLRINRLRRVLHDQDRARRDRQRVRADRQLQLGGRPDGQHQGSGPAPERTLARIHHWTKLAITF